MPENVVELMKNDYSTKRILVKRELKKDKQIIIDITNRFRPSKRIGFVWNTDFADSIITHWRAIDLF